MTQHADSAAMVGTAADARAVAANGVDLVWFDPNTVAERAAIHSPHQVSVGIRKVWVNGEIVFEEGKATGKYPGKVIRR